MVNTTERKPNEINIPLTETLLLLIVSSILLINNPLEITHQLILLMRKTKSRTYLIYPTGQLAFPNGTLTNYSIWRSI